MSAKLEDIMQAIVAKVGAIVDGSSNTVFKTVSRQKLVSASLSSSEKPAVSVQRLMDRVVAGTDTASSQKNRLLFKLQVIGVQIDQELIDPEMVELKAYLDSAFLNCTLGGLVGAIRYFGADASSFVPIPLGTEDVAYECVYAVAKPSFPNG